MMGVKLTLPLAVLGLSVHYIKFAVELVVCKENRDLQI